MPLVVADESKNFAVSQQFRMLRTHLSHLNEQGVTGQVTLLTSSITGEGKSFVSSNLAITLAYADKKTILLDMDLRKPKISVDFGLAKLHPGISNYLNGETTDIKALIQQSPIPGLDILSSGDIASNSSELLLKVKLAELFIELKKTYDHIIIDSPPIHLLTDAMIISRFVDVTLYIIRQGFTSKNELEFISELHSQNKFPKLNIVFNGVKVNKYGYGYGSSNSYRPYNNKKGSRSFKSKLKGFLGRF
jgi:capsular exopolysaccharide synthesis family protein